MTNPWTDIVKVLEPKYEQYAIEMYGNPTIKPRLWKSVRGWSVMLEEQWPEEIINAFKLEIFDDIVIWTSEQLELWPGCKRSAYDTWVFRSKQDAEKFITLFNLKWPQ